MDLPEDNPLREEFYTKVTGKPAARVKGSRRAWRLPPRVLPKEAPSAAELKSSWPLPPIPSPIWIKPTSTAREGAVCRSINAGVVASIKPSNILLSLAVFLVIIVFAGAGRGRQAGIAVRVFRHGFSDRGRGKISALATSVMCRAGNARVLSDYAQAGVYEDRASTINPDSKLGLQAR